MAAAKISGGEMANRILGVKHREKRHQQSAAHRNEEA
jgi:hypothetical protein